MRKPRRKKQEILFTTAHTAGVIVTVFPNGTRAVSLKPPECNCDGAIELRMTIEAISRLLGTPEGAAEIIALAHRLAPLDLTQDLPPTQAPADA